MTTSSLVITFTPDPKKARPSEKYWLHLVPIIKEPPTATVKQVAMIANKLFDVDSCVDTGNGGDAHPDEMPTDQDVAKTAKDVLGVDPCGPDDTGDWTGQVKIYRSDPTASYRLICTNGKILAITTHSEQVDETIAVTGKTSVDLEKPVYSGFSCYLPDAELIGSTLWFGGDEYTGFVHVQYASGYDLAEVSVAGIDDDPQTAHVIAFYHGFVTEADIEPPKKDPATEQALDCSAHWSMDDDAYKPARCLQPIRHTVRCECFGQEIIDTYETQEDVSCPDYAQCPGGFIGCDWYYPIQDVTEYVPCTEVTYNPDGSVKYINHGDWPGYDADYYEDKCCNPPTVSLPPCKTKVQVFRGGVEIEGGPEKYRQQYGDDVQLIGVSPEDCVCGKITTKQVVQQKNCCDEATQLEWDSENSATVIADNSSCLVQVIGGKLPLKVSLRGNGFWLDANRSFREGIVDSRTIQIHTGDACGPCRINVDDGCSSTSGGIRSTNGHWSLEKKGDCSEFDFGIIEADNENTNDQRYYYAIIGDVKYEQYYYSSSQFGPLHPINECSSFDFSSICENVIIPKDHNVICWSSNKPISCADSYWSCFGVETDKDNWGRFGGGCLHLYRENTRKYKWKC